MAESDGVEVIKEGFICPVCHEDLQSSINLLSHFQDVHSGEQDLLKSLKGLVGKAKKKILKLDEQDLEQFKRDSVKKYYIDESEPQELGCLRTHTEYFKSIRIDRLDHRTTETNLLIRRLDKLLQVQGADRKQQEQKLVAWLDGTTVTRCPSCASIFNITKRQHHCRLCGSIMCNSCSQFLSYETAKSIVIPKQNEENDHTSSRQNSDTLRVCSHCICMLESRRNVQLRQMYPPQICILYDQLQKLKGELQLSVNMYHKVYSSLTSGNTSYQLQDAQSLKSTIAKQAEKLDTISKQVVTITSESNVSQPCTLQMSIRRAFTQFIKDNILTLPAVPSPAELEQIKHDNLFQQNEVEDVGPAVNIKRITVTTGWSPANVTNVSEPEVLDDPLVEQMKIVKNYIEQARKAHRFDEVDSLEDNLRMLKESRRSQQKLDHRKME